MSLYSTDGSSEQELTKTIHGYCGYRLVEHRTVSDQRLRDFFAGRIRDIVNGLEQYARQVETRSDAQFKHEVATISRRLTQLAHSLYTPGYQDAAFFTEPIVDDAVLAQIYNIELEINDFIQYLIDEVAVLNCITDPMELDAFFTHFINAVDNLNHTIVEREFLLTGVTEWFV